MYMLDCDSSPIQLPLHPSGSSNMLNLLHTSASYERILHMREVVIKAIWRVILMMHETKESYRPSFLETLQDSDLTQEWMLKLHMASTISERINHALPRLIYTGYSCKQGWFCTPCLKTPGLRQKWKAQFSSLQTQQTLMQAKSHRQILDPNHSNEEY
ncbi:hypothetical protein MUK42_04385 [Musa troglodytarum]|uniref:Uncharacterized protein n=1 Tax=Musa troglodytarum TaxID=320322 RepID=A0A9E7G8I8_9LILI|nr:hypothetical protein MUK42_04385 [Musa troglodytarum]